MSVEKTGVFNKLWIQHFGATTVWQSLEFMPGSSLALQQQIHHPGGMTGSRQLVVDRNRETQRHPAGSLTFTPTPSELDWLLPWAFGVAKDGSNNFVLPELHNTGLAFRMERDAAFYEYTGCVCSSVQFTCSEGSFLQATFGVDGIDEVAKTGNPVTDGGGTLSAVSGSPYTINDCVLSVLGTNYEFRGFDVRIDHMLEVKFNNNLVATNIRSTGIRTTVNLSLPLGDALAGSTLYGAGAAGVAVVATFTNGGDSLTFTMPAVVFPKPPLELGTMQNMSFPIQGSAYRSTGGTSQLTVKHINV